MPSLRTKRLSPRPPEASISHQTSRHKSAHADVLASVAERPRWLTPCPKKTTVRDILGGRPCDAQEHEKSEELCSVDVFDEVCLDVYGEFRGMCSGRASVQGEVRAVQRRVGG